MPRKTKTTRGKQKIEIKRIQSEEARQICFSKRRSGVFTKASDLSTLCGPDVAVLVFSPRGKPFSFGSPAVNPVIDRFVLDGSSSSGPGYHCGPPSNKVQQLSKLCMDLTDQLHACKAKSAMLKEKLSSPTRNLEFDWFENMDDLEPHELGRLAGALKQVKANADAHINALLLHGTGALSSTTPVMTNNQVEGASSSSVVMAAASSNGVMAGNVGTSNYAVGDHLVAEMTMSSPPSWPYDEQGFGPGFLF
ncbi:agamous-like MADS-box protein AGL29 [Cocos nucifera]|uniref:Agamous-like MADS-box protein AGL29 n=1 Tax=Cocos nucifera TaxID=13894 RepID=A0A8K0ID05_COCNU|nr:agamous-like MADS-box protein AGL29 [Cocos nucifera]